MSFLSMRQGTGVFSSTRLTATKKHGGKTDLSAFAHLITGLACCWEIHLKAVECLDVAGSIILSKRMAAYIPAISMCWMNGVWVISRRLPFSGLLRPKSENGSEKCLGDCRSHVGPVHMQHYAGADVGVSVSRLSIMSRACPACARAISVFLMLVCLN